MIEATSVPHDIDAEEGVNGSLLLDSGAFSAVQFLTPDDFFSEQNRFVFRACQNIMGRNGVIDQITVAEELNRMGKSKEAGGAAYLIHLGASTPTSLDVKHYAEIVHRLSVSRALMAAASQISSLGLAADPDIGGSLKKAETILLNVRRKANNHTSDVVSPMDMASKMVDMLKRDAPPLMWGFKDLDDLTGGIYPQDYIVVGARPSVGKTQFMLDAANNIARKGKKVLFASVEMTINPVIERHIARSLGMSVWDYRRMDKDGDVWKKEYEAKYMVAADRLSAIPIHYLFERRSSDSIFENARRMQETVGLDIIFVDYLQLLSDCYRGVRENHSVSVGFVSHNLKALTTDLNVPVVVASQLNRQVEYRDDKHPVIADLRESGDIEQDADVIFLLHRPELYAEKGEDESVKGKLSLMMAKNRQLGTASNPVVLQWLPDKFRYDNAANG